MILRRESANDRLFLAWRYSNMESFSMPWSRYDIGIISCKRRRYGRNHDSTQTVINMHSVTAYILLIIGRPLLSWLQCLSRSYHDCDHINDVPCDLWCFIICNCLGERILCVSLQRRFYKCWPYQLSVQEGSNSCRTTFNLGTTNHICNFFSQLSDDRGHWMAIRSVSY